MAFLQAFTLLHVAISLVAIATGLIVVRGMLRSQRQERLTAIFLATTVATSASGFGFPFEKFLPSHAFGILSLLILGPTIYARYSRGLQGKWRGVYVLGATSSLYLNVFVLVVQMFLKVPGLQGLAPTQSEPPFAIAQAVVLVAFLAAGFAAMRRFRPVPIAAT